MHFSVVWRAVTRAVHCRTRSKRIKITFFVYRMWSGLAATYIVYMPSPQCLVCLCTAYTAFDDARINLGLSLKLVKRGEKNIWIRYHCILCAILSFRVEYLMQHRTHYRAHDRKFSYHVDINLLKYYRQNMKMASGMNINIDNKRKEHRQTTVALSTKHAKDGDGDDESVVCTRTPQQINAST